MVKDMIRTRKILMQQLDELHEVSMTPQYESHRKSYCECIVEISKELRKREWFSAMLFIAFLYSIKCIAIDRK